MKSHIMIDLETLGTDDNAVVTSIGAVAFDEDSVDTEAGFTCNLNIQQQLDVGRKITRDTLLFWLKQAPETLRATLSGAASVKGALTGLSRWVESRYAPYKVCVWGKGPSFDMTILKSLYRDFEIKPFWNFWNERCVRTALMLPEVAAVKQQPGFVVHCALDDAVYQALQVQKYLQFIKNSDLY